MWLLFFVISKYYLHKAKRPVEAEQALKFAIKVSLLQLIPYIWFFKGSKLR